MSTNKISNILFVIAMEAEAKPLVDRLDLKQIPNLAAHSPAVLHAGEYKGIKVHVATNGKSNTFGVDNVGTVPAALTTFLGISMLTSSSNLQ
jgi:5'-methylthioadenosine nucleosidase